MLEYMLVNFVNIAFEVYYWLIIARIIISFVPDIKNPIVRSLAVFVYEVTEPVLRPIRKVVPVVGSGGVGIDFSPVIAIILLSLIRRVLVQLIYILL